MTFQKPPIRGVGGGSSNGYVGCKKGEFYEKEVQNNHVYSANAFIFDNCLCMTNLSSLKI